MTDTASLTDRQLIERVWDVEEIKKLMSRRAYLRAGDRRAEELQTLWVSQPENGRSAVYGRNTGWYLGLDRIFEAYVRGHRRRDGAGDMQHYAVSTPLVELAGDGQTAKGRWFSLGEETEAGAEGTTARWVLDSLSAVFRREPDGWRIWQLVESNESFCPVGEGAESVPIMLDAKDDPTEREYQTPDVRFLTHENLFLAEDQYPPLPEPYESYDPAAGLGPEGHPAYRRQRR